MMDLLVHGNIIHLDLKISDVYKKVWLQSHDKNVPMRVVYRMRGLMGEVRVSESFLNIFVQSGTSADTLHKATEEFIEKFNDDESNDEEVFKRAAFILDSNGFQVIFSRTF